MFFIRLNWQLISHAVRQLSRVNRFQGLDPSNRKRVELLNGTLQHRNDSRFVQKNGKDKAHLGCAKDPKKRSAGTFRALCSCEASYSTEGVIKATIRLSNRPPTSDFSALTKS